MIPANKDFAHEVVKILCDDTKDMRHSITHELIIHLRDEALTPGTDVDRILDDLTLLSYHCDPDAVSSAVVIIASQVPGVNASRCQSLVERGNVHDMIRFARNVPEVYIPSLQQCILKSGDPSSITRFAQYAPDIDLPLLEKTVLKSGSARHTYEFAAHVHGADVAACQKVLLDNDQDNPEYAYTFARDVPGAEIPPLQKRILEIGDLEYILAFARDVEGADVYSCEQAILASGDVTYIDRFSRDVEGSRIKDVVTA